MFKKFYIKCLTCGNDDQDTLYVHADDFGNYIECEKCKTEENSVDNLYKEKTK